MLNNSNSSYLVKDLVKQLPDLHCQERKIISDLLMKTIRDEKNKQFELRNVKRKAIIKIEFTTKLDIFEKNYFQKVLMAQ